MTLLLLETAVKSGFPFWSRFLHDFFEHNFSHFNNDHSSFCFTPLSPKEEGRKRYNSLSNITKNSQILVFFSIGEELTITVNSTPSFLFETIRGLAGQIRPRVAMNGGCKLTCITVSGWKIEYSYNKAL